MAAHPPAPARALLVLVLIAALAGGWYAWSRTSGSSADPEWRFSGTVEAQDYEVAALIGGRIDSVSATEGAQVRRGQTLFELNAGVLDQQVEAALAGLRAAEAALQQSRDDDESDAQIAAAQARVDQAKASVRAARVQRGYATISSPASGTITALASRRGENAAPGRVLATVTDLESLWVNVYVPESQLGDVSVGDAATVTADDGSAYTARVTRISDQAEFTPNSIETKDQRTKLVYAVRISLDRSAADPSASVTRLKPGMPVDVDIDVAAAAAAK